MALHLHHATSRSRGVGLQPRGAIDRAVQKIIWTINDSDYNLIEITQIAVRRLTFCTERVSSSTLGI